MTLLLFFLLIRFFPSISFFRHSFGNIILLHSDSNLIQFEGIQTTTTTTTKIKQKQEKNGMDWNEWTKNFSPFCQKERGKNIIFFTFFLGLTYC